VGDVDDFMELTVVELMRRAAKFVVQHEGDSWKLMAQWKDGQMDDPPEGPKAA
jgi:hypothetical protein